MNSKNEEQMTTDPADRPDSEGEAIVANTLWHGSGSGGRRERRPNDGGRAAPRQGRKHGISSGAPQNFGEIWETSRWTRQLPAAGGKTIRHPGNREVVEDRILSWCSPLTGGRTSLRSQDRGYRPSGEIAGTSASEAGCSCTVEPSSYRRRRTTETSVSSGTLTRLRLCDWRLSSRPCQTRTCNWLHNAESRTLSTVTLALTLQHSGGRSSRSRLSE